MPSLMPVAARKRSSRLEDRIQTRGHKLRGDWDPGVPLRRRRALHKLSAHAKAVTMNSASARERTATAENDTRGRTSSADSAKFAKDRDRQAATRRGFSAVNMVSTRRFRWFR